MQSMVLKHYVYTMARMEEGQGQWKYRFVAGYFVCVWVMETC